MNRQILFPILLSAACLLCACAPTPSASDPDSGSQPQVSTSQPQTNAESPTYTQEDVQAAFARSSSAENAAILDCVVAEDGACDLMGVVQYVRTEDPETCWLGFVSLDGIVYSAGPRVRPADDDSLTYHGDGTVSMNLLQEDTGEIYPYQLTFQRTDSGVHYKAEEGLGEDSETP